MIHPAKNPMKGGFSLDKFLPNLSPEDAEALGKMIDDMEAAKENGRKAANDAASALDLLSRVRFALGDNGTRMQADLIAYCAELREAKARSVELENSLVEQGAILEAVMGALKGDEPSDFMQSFPDVSHAWWVYRLAYPKP